MNNKMNPAQMREVVDMCNFPEYKFLVRIDGRGEIYLQGEYEEPDTVTGELEKQLTRRWFLSPEMTKSEIVQTVFKCVMTSMEHRVREWFKFEGSPVYCPHFDVDALKKLCDENKFVYREQALRKAA